MMMGQMGRSTFNTQYNYQLVATSDNIVLKHCGNCIHHGNALFNVSPGECSLIKQCGAIDISINSRQGLCDLWQRKKDD